MSEKTLSRRAALLRIGALAGAAYTVPAFTTVSMAHASGASGSSASSASSESSASSQSSPSSQSSASSAASQSSASSGVSRPSGPVADPVVNQCFESTNTDASFNQCLTDNGVDTSAL